MKKHLLIYLLACATFSAYAQAPGFSFAKRIGGASTEYNTDLHRTKDSQENLFVSGTFGETCDFDPGPGTQTRTSTGFLDIYVAKYDSSGNFLWVKTFGSAAQSDYSFCSTLDPSGNIVVTGYISGVVDLDPGPGVFSTTGAGFHAFAVKLGANGTFLWGKQFDSNASLSTDQVFIQAAASASDNSIYLGGYFGGSVDFDPGAGISGLTAGSGTRNGFILKLLPNGDFAWAFSLFNTVETAVNDICIDTDGNLNMVGRFSGTQDFDPSAFGIFNLSASQGSAFIWKLTSGGTYQAAYALRAINSGSSCAAGHIRVDKNKNILVNGSFTDKVDFDPNPTITNNYTSSAPTCYVLKINSAGSFSWLRMISASVASFSADMEVENTDNGYIYLAGSFEGTLNFSLGSVSASKTSVGQTDGFAIRIDSNGRTNWVKTFGSLFADKGRSIELTSKRNVVVLGDFQSTVDFNTDGVSQPLTSAGSWDGFVLKFNGADVQPVCPPTSVFTNCSGTISDGSGAANYANNLNCNWSIHSPGASSITITFTEFETEALYDYVRIYSGTSTADSLIKSFSGPGSLQKFNVPGEHVFITFSSDQSANGAGFSLNYRCNFNAKPEAAFSSAQQNFSAGGATRFTDLSTNLPTSWKWSFPGAFPSSSTLESPPNITFPASGCYTVSMIVGNALGFDTVTQTCYISTTPLATCSELFFSEYVEGSGNNKVIEIFNPLETSKSLSGYTLEIYSNGDLSPTTTWTLSGSIAAKDVYVFANSTADASVLAIADRTSSAFSFNGNDAVFLRKDGVLIDAIGDPYLYPGAGFWTVGSGTTENQTLVRKTAINKPISYWPAAAFQYDAFPFNTLSGLGSHTASCATTTDVVQAGFKANVLNIIVGYAVQFTDTSKGNIIDWEWKFPGSTTGTSALKSPGPISYFTPGCYEVRLKVRSLNGLDSTTKTCYINVSNPVDCEEIFFSEYIEGTSSNRVLELYNPRNSDFNLQGYSIQFFANGSSSPTNTFNLQGIIPPHGVYVLANPSANAQIQAKANVVSGIINFTGNDAIAIKKDGNTVDVIGIIGQDPGVSWPVGTGSTFDFTLVRKVDVNRPTSSWTTSQNQWNVFPVGTISDLGMHTGNCAIAPIAGFRASGLQIVAGKSVSFTDTSKNTPTSWQWVFSGGNPSTSTTQNPGNIQYSVAGCYPVFLKVTNANGKDSITKTCYITVLPLTAPTLSQATGTYTTPQTVTITSQPSTLIYYTTNGNTPLLTVPNSFTKLYSGPIPINQTTTVRAVAVSGNLVSPVTARFYTISVPSVVEKPVISLPTGSYTGTQTVSMSVATAGAQIYYTTTGNTPVIGTTFTKLYSNPIQISVSTTIKAIGVKSGATNSAQAISILTITAANPTVATPVINPSIGTYPGPIQVTISCATPGSTIYYTTSGNIPLIGAGFTKIYTSPITITAGVTIRAMATAPGFNNSAVAVSFISIAPGREAVADPHDPAGSSEELMAIPNPSSTGRFRIHFNTNPERHGRFSVLGLNGKEIQSGVLTEGDAFELDLSAQPKGLYILKVQDGFKMQTLRLSIH